MLYLTRTILIAGCLMVLAWPNVSGQTMQSNDLRSVTVNEKIGFIDNTGRLVVQTQFDDYVSDFSEGLAEFMDPHALPKYPFHKSGYIDITGNIVIKQQFDQAYDFSNGRAQVVIGDLTSFIDKSGKQIIKLASYQAARSFHEGLAAIHSNFEFWYIDIDGKAVIPKQAGIPKDFSEGLACVYLPVNGKFKAGYIDKNGKVIIAPQYEDGFDFSDGIALVKISGKYGYIDKMGKVVIEPVFKSAHNFSNGRARVSKGEKWGFIDREGHYIIPEIYDYSTGDFSEGLAAICRDHLCGYMGVDGNWVIKPAFQFAYEFRGGLAHVDYRTYIDKTGKIIWQSRK